MENLLDHRLTTLMVVAQTGSLTAAAQQLFITQPAVSQQLASLEGGDRAFAFASGMAAIYAAFAALSGPGKRGRLDCRSGPGLGGIKAKKRSSRSRMI